MSKVISQLGDLVEEMDNVNIGKVTDDGDTSLVSPEKIFKHPLQVKLFQLFLTF